MMTAASYCVMSDRYIRCINRKIITEDTHVIAYVIMIFIWRKNMNKSFIKKYGTLLLLAAGAGIIFQLPYIRETFYVPIQNAMNLTDAQMGMLSSGYATMATFSYFVGGIVADKFSARKLLAFSFIATGILGLWFSTFPGYNISRLIFVLMGVSTVITYW